MLPVRLRSLRRVLGLALLIAAPAWQLEAAIGASRDGPVHHETAGAAATHAPASTGDHGHEDGLPPAQHHHGNQHQHGTPADQCSHAHGFAALSALDISFPSELLPQAQFDQNVSLTLFPTNQFHPPRS